ncbi:hypothetical protein CMI37_20460 [Candidatus Pacearchaeota archaeon]|mgnify:CR=1 FL=1|jgi:hypothetical protein|nr:hypothetical protein [Candidatus Pacearchaeota archaeon]|tara:strand:- start:3316 stop:3630 length:315 start_codon:yes stop_codon:yes gene_type:complete
MTTATILAERASRGAAHMDEYLPGWWRDVDVPRLDMGSHLLDVIGQNYSSWPQGFRELDLDLNDGGVKAVGLGFFLGINAKAYPQLTEAWVREIQKRREDVGYA